MKKLSNLNRSIHFINIAVLTFALGSSVAAEAGTNHSLSELSAQIEDLSRRLSILDMKVNEQRTETRYIALENSEFAAPRRAEAGQGRNKIRSRQTQK